MVGSLDVGSLDGCVSIKDLFCLGVCVVTLCMVASLNGNWWGYHQAGSEADWF